MNPVDKMLAELEAMAADLEGFPDGARLTSAAALIRSLSAERDDLKGGLDATESFLSAEQDLVAKQDGIIATAEAENAVLRSALVAVRAEFKVEVYGGKIGGISHAGDALPRIIKTLDAAIGGEQV